MSSIRDIKISVVTVVLNSVETIEQTLQSYSDQQNVNKELIVIDGCSTDGTLDILDRYKNIIDVVVSEKDEGISDAFNKGIERSSGDIVFLLSADDYLPNPNVLSKVITVFEKDESIDIVYGNIVSKNMQHENVIRPLSLTGITYNFPIKHPGMFIRKDLYQKLGGYDLKCKMAMDYEFALRACKVSSIFYYIDDVLCVVREGGANQQNRIQTINEVYNISITYGGSFLWASFYRYKKILVYIIKKYLLRIY